jgi:hypothetical protein
MCSRREVRDTAWKAQAHCALDTADDRPSKKARRPLAIREQSFCRRVDTPGAVVMAASILHNPTDRGLPRYDPLEVLLMVLGVALITVVAVAF